MAKYTNYREMTEELVLAVGKVLEVKGRGDEDRARRMVEPLTTLQIVHDEAIEQLNIKRTV